MKNVSLLRMCLLVQIRGDISTVIVRLLASSVNTGFLLDHAIHWSYVKFTLGQ